ncbi:DUF1320 domain-containing protein [Thermospira aquatica]|uniref:DUF1320 domain-containing protein n=1 Tax=Thermospira aquatica TaxID=2828656 RepID=A0AAX3BDY9_9SPIR|nr:DUF1320 domain-containing protein [Thermospira aquatica]URA10542.1 DUF1320 domain-containing protein [Thermospira aquatica]
MLYCSKEDIFTQMDKVKVKAQLQDSGEQGNEWEIKLEKLISNATSEIDGFIRNRYSVPLSPVPAFIRDICIRIVKYKIVMRKGFVEKAPEQVIVEDYKFAIRQLERVMKGELDIGLQISSTESVTTPKVLVKTKKRIFDDEFWRGF